MTHPRPGPRPLRAHALADESHPGAAAEARLEALLPTMAELVRTSQAAIAAAISLREQSRRAAAVTRDACEQSRALLVALGRWKPRLNHPPEPPGPG